MARLNLERQKELGPKRFEYAKNKILELGLKIIYENESSEQISFYFQEETVTIYTYSGWHTGKSIKDGRGIENLLKQLKQ